MSFFMYPLTRSSSPLPFRARSVVQPWVLSPRFPVGLDTRVAPRNPSASPVTHRVISVFLGDGSPCSFFQVASPPPVHRPSPHRRIAASPYRPSPAFNPSFDSDSRVCLRRTRGYATSFVVNRPRGRFSFDCSSNSSHGLASSCKSIRYRSPSHLVHTPRFRISFKYIIQNTTSMRDTPNDRTVHEVKKSPPVIEQKQ